MPNLLLPVGDWTPDAATYTTAGAPIFKNTYPRTDGADGPLNGPVVLSDALAAQCIGAFAARDAGGTVSLFAGTSSKLYIQSGLSWIDRSTGSYAVPAGQHWRFAQFGDRVLATNFADEVQTHTLGSGANFATLNAAAPIARYIATIEPGFVMLGYYSDVAVQASGLWWSGINDATSWPTPGTAAATSVESDNTILPTGGAITGMLPAVGQSSAAVFTERALYRVQYVGAPLVFTFVEVDRSRGCIAPQSLVQVGPLAYFLSEDGFCTFDGTQVANIGAGKVDQYFLADLDQTQLERVYGAVDFARKLIIWAYPNTAASGGNPNRWIIYSYGTGRWRWGDDAALTCTYLFGARTPGYTLDTLDSVLPGGIDAGSFIVDSPLYQGGTRLLAGFDTSNRLVAYNGTTLAGRMETADTDVDGQRIYVSGIRPLIDGTGVSAGVGYRNDLADTVTYSTPTTAGVNRICPQRVSARYARGVITTDAGAAWTRFQGARFMFDEDGER